MTTLTPTNDQRAALAAVAMKAFEPNLPVKMQDETTLIDLLTDLRHWCDRNEVDFDSVCSTSKDHHALEVAEESGGSQQPPSKTFAQIEWCAEDVQEHRPAWTKEQCEKFLEDNEDGIAQAMCMAGNDYFACNLPFEKGDE